MAGDPGKSHNPHFHAPMIHAVMQMNQWQSEPRADVVIEQEADIAYIQGTLDTVSFCYCAP